MTDFVSDEFIALESNHSIYRPRVEISFHHRPPSQQQPPKHSTKMFTDTTNGTNVFISVDDDNQDDKIYSTMKIKLSFRRNSYLFQVNKFVIFCM